MNTPIAPSPSRCIITSVSNKFFPSLLNLLGSIETNYPEHPHIYIYDLGLSWNFRKELELLDMVTVMDMPHFSPFWRSCYTWKTYIFDNPFANINFYIDAGCEILRPLDEIFKEIEKNDYITVEQGVNLGAITPIEYKRIFDIDPRHYEEHSITAGIFGFKKDSSVTPAIKELFDSGVAGLCLGFSSRDLWKNKGVNKSQFIRNCDMFRHDTTMLNLILRKHILNLRMQDVNKYGGAYTAQDHPEQLIWNLRMNYRSLSYLSDNILHKNPPLIARMNRMIVNTYIFARRLRLKIKGK